MAVDSTDLLPLAQQVAALLDLDSRAERCPEYANGAVRIVDSEGRQILISPQRPYSFDRLTVQASLPESSQDFPTVCTPCIRVSLRCGPEHLAKHIRRRLLPKHAEVVRKLRELTARHNAAQAARTEVACRLTAALPGSLNAQPAQSRHETVATFEGRPRNGFHLPRVTAHIDRNGESVDLSMDGLTPEEAETVLRALSGMERWR